MAKLLKSQTLELRNELTFLANQLGFQLNDSSEFFNCFNLFVPMGLFEIYYIKVQLLNCLKLLKSRDFLSVTDEDFANEKERLESIENILRKLDPMLKESLSFYSLNNEYSKDTDSYKYLQLLHSIISTQIVKKNVLRSAWWSSKFFSNSKNSRPKKSFEEKFALILLAKCIKKIIRLNKSTYSVEHGVPLRFFQSAASKQNKKLTPTLFMMMFLNLIGEDKREETIRSYLKLDLSSLTEYKTIDELKTMIDDFTIVPPIELSKSISDLKEFQLASSREKLINALDLNEIFNNEI